MRRLFAKGSGGSFRLFPPAGVSHHHSLPQTGSLRGRSRSRKQLKCD